MPDASPWIDITRTLRPGMHHWPGDPGFTLEPISRITTPGTANLSVLRSTTHIGTHLDAPLHFVPGGCDVASIPLSVLCGPACVIHIPHDGDIRADDLADADPPAGHRVLLCTAGRHCWRQPEFDRRFPALRPEAARWLIERNTPLLGVDYLSIDPFGSPDHPAHQLLLGAGTVILEGLDLDDVPAGRYELIALPLKIADADGSPVRAILRNT